jgi:hypothetical protein
MEINALYASLLNAYSTENLNKISLVLIRLYKDRQIGSLRKIADVIADFVHVEIMDDGKGFSSFMMLYHPDRQMVHLDAIHELARNNDVEGLTKYSHILLLDDVDEITLDFTDFEEIDYSPVYEWDFDVNGYSVINDYEPPLKTKTSVVGCDFYEAVKKRHFESAGFHFPPHYLNDLDEFELSSSCINNLDGVENCIHAQSMDLSDNMIYDLGLLAGLSRLEYLNLADNDIENIDPLSNLLHLKTLILSNNNIVDISPMFDLPRLEYLEISGNRVAKSQIENLIDLGVEVDYVYEST